jgi:hypothetical protein
VYPKAAAARSRLSALLEARGETAEAYDLLLEATAYEPTLLSKHEADLRRLALAMAAPSPPAAVTPPASAAAEPAPAPPASAAAEPAPAAPPPRGAGD